MNISDEIIGMSPFLRLVQNAQCSGSAGRLDVNSSWTRLTGDTHWHLAALLGLDFVGRRAVGDLAPEKLHDVTLDYIRLHYVHA